MCTFLLTGRNIPVEEAQDYEDWYRIFKPGMEWALETLATSVLVNKSFVIAPMVFAFRSYPSGVMAFGHNLATQENLKVGMPEMTVIKALQSHRAKDDDHARTRKARVANGKSRGMSRKVLNAILAKLEGRELHVLQDGNRGMEYFREVYKEEKAPLKLMAPWTNGGGEPEIDEHGRPIHPVPDIYIVGKKEVTVPRFLSPFRGY